MFCNNCGNSLGNEVKFCGKCGKSVSVQNGEVTSTAPAPKAQTFWTIYFKTGALTTAILSLLFWFLGSFDEDGAETFFGIIIFSALLSVLFTYIIREMKGGMRQGVESLSEEDRKKYKGISGWLSLVALGLVVTFGYSVFSFFETLVTQEDYQGAPVLFMYDFLTGAVAVALVSYVIYLFFKEKKDFPRYFIYLYLYLTAVNIITLSMFIYYSVSGAEMQEVTTLTARTALGGIIWGLYVTKSKRSRATFIND